MTGNNEPTESVQDKSALLRALNALSPQDKAALLRELNAIRAELRELSAMLADLKRQRAKIEVALLDCAPAQGTA